MITLGFYILTKYTDIYFITWYNTLYFSNKITPISYDFVHKNSSVCIYIKGEKSQQHFYLLLSLMYIYHINY